jgi:UDP-N-acetylmuramate: L-alanyl-gamma-D-glutamyl-meso-diaminopimelate ligase
VAGARSAADRWVLAVAGTHGKTTTSGMLAWILEDAGLSPGFLIGGVPGISDLSARLGEQPFFVIEADEYDTAFFDKRAKFVHYRPRTLVLNNLEYDHADIYPDLAAIERQFQHLLRTVPGSGRILCNGDDASLARVLAAWAAGVSWSISRGGRTGDCRGVAQARRPGDFSRVRVLHGHALRRVHWPLIGMHNVDNALAAIGAARHAGVPIERGIEALERASAACARRMQLRGEAAGVKVYDDFAHHPTAIATTLDGTAPQRRARAHRGGARAALEHHARWACTRRRWPQALGAADEVWLYAPAGPRLGRARGGGPAREARARGRGPGCAGGGPGARAASPAITR